MFNKDFFPTPPEVIDTMLAGVDIIGKNVQDPSAGKADLLKALHQKGAGDLFYCEIEPELSKICEGYATCIGDDFLKVTAEQVSHVQLIVMNPPFSEGAAHILHAWNIAPEGCEIVSLCNWNTLEKNHYLNRRQLTHVIEQNGLSQNLGAVFSSAERTTGVEVGLVRLFKPGISNDSFEGFFMDEEPDEDNGPGIMPYNEVREVVQRYVGAVKAFELLEAQAGEIDTIIKPLGMDSGFSCSMNYNEKLTTKAAFAKALQKKCWNWIIEKRGIRHMVTSGVMKDINRFVEQQEKYPFTMRNVYQMLYTIAATRSQVMDRAIEEVFDKITMHHHENRYHVEGWKTNKHWLVGKKFIFDWTTKVSYNGAMEFNHANEKLDDMTKALQYITGDPTRILSLYRFAYGELKWIEDKDGNKELKDVAREEPLQFSTWYDWGFFQIKGFKKGTLHVKFKDENVWAMFNQAVARIKGYPLPEKF